jgi:hypothetical protein
MSGLKEIVTVEQDVPTEIADLVHFIRFLAGGWFQNPHILTLKDVANKPDHDLVRAARAYWDSAHGED